MDREEDVALIDHFYDYTIPKEEALKLCVDHLKGEWETISADDIALTVIKCGFVNRLFVCENKKSGSKVLIRLYGGRILGKENILRSSDGYEDEILVFYTMAEKGIGPKLFGVFPNGRLEQYFDDAAIMTPADGMDYDLMEVFARKLAQMHTTDMPFNKNPKDYLNIISGIMDKHWHQFITSMKSVPLTDEQEHIREFVLNYDMTSAVNWYKETEARIRGKVTLSHGDMNPGNCLIRKNAERPEDRVILLDFEFARYGYRGGDIGHHFQCRRFDVEKFHAGELIAVEYPSEEARRHFIREYINELKKSPHFDEETDTEDQILLEAEFYGPVYDLFFQSWFISEYEEMSKKFTFPVNPVLCVNRVIEILEDRKSSVIDLLSRKSNGN